MTPVDQSAAHNADGGGLPPEAWDKWRHAVHQSMFQSIADMCAACEHQDEECDECRLSDRIAESLLPVLAEISGVNLGAKGADHDVR